MVNRPRGRSGRDSVADLGGRRRLRAASHRSRRTSKSGRINLWTVLAVWAAAAAVGLASGLVDFAAPPPATAPAGAGGLVGQATVIDGDTLEIGGRRIRLHGIDAPESAQRCEADGAACLCGRRAAFALADRIGRRTVTCAPKDIDRYGRVVAVCAVGGEDLNAFMVRRGWALAYRDYSTAYLDAEAAARAESLGLWRGEFVPPWDWRRGTRLVQPAANEPGDCRIKGNVNRDGARIYHVPGGRWYERTKISEAKGERWFCSEAEARAAGWRPAGQ
jgi:endonuclease YncB( thermonuclease family)